MFKRALEILIKVIFPSEAISKRGPIIIILILLVMEIFGIFKPIEDSISNGRFSISIGAINVSLYTIFQTSLWLIFLFWVNSHLTRLLDKQLGKLSIHVATRGIIYKVLQALLYTVTALIAMNIIGINLSSLALFSGALGIGIGFGLQKIAANMISGFIITFERNLAPGTLVELENGRIGYIRLISIRYTLLETLDGLEILIPNEELVTNKLINWNLSHPYVRVNLDIGVSYDSDIKLANDLILEAAMENQKLYEQKPPTVFLKDFGDNAVIFELIYWVRDINKNWRDIRSEILFSVWHKFKQNNISIPYPQLDLHIQNLAKPIIDDIKKT